MKKRLLAMLMTVVMVFSMLPMAAFADTVVDAAFTANVDQTNVEAGDTITVTVTLDNTITAEDGATMIQGELYYNDEELTFASITAGADYEQFFVDSDNGNMVNRTNVTENGVTVDRVQFNWFSGKSVAKEFPAGTVVTIEFTANTPATPEAVQAEIYLDMWMQTNQGVDVLNETYDPVAITVCPGHTYEDGTCTICGAEDPDYVADPAETAQYVIKVNDVVMELVDGGIQQGCDGRSVSDDVQIFNVTVPSGTTAVTVELKEDATANYANVQYMSGTAHSFGGNAMPAFEADVVNYDGLCINCGGKYYHVFVTEQEQPGEFQSITTDMEGDVIVTEQEMIDGWIPYYHVVVPRASNYAYITYPANTIDVYEGQAHVVEWKFDGSHCPDKFWPATENADGSVTVELPIVDIIVEEPGTGTAPCFWKASGSEVIEGFTFSYTEDTTIFLVTLAAGNGYTTDGAGYVKTGEDYSFTVDIKNGYDATNMVVKVNGEVVTADENGVYTVYAVAEDLVITVEGVEAIPDDGDVEIYFSVEETEYFVEQGGVIWALEELTVPYFDLALYDMEYLYYNPDCYVDGQASQAPGTAETAEGVVTLLHMLIWVTEVYYNGLDPVDAGQGWLATDGGWNGFSVYSASAGSAFFNFWDFGSDFNYYVNYEYPLGAPGWGATCDQIKLSDGDVVSMRYNNNSGSVGTYHHFGEKALVTKTVNVGQSFDLTLYRTGQDNANYTTPVYNAGAGHNVYLFTEDTLDVDPANGELVGTTDDNGKVTIDTTDLDLGTYYIVTNSMSPAVMLLTVEGGEHIHEYDEVVTAPTCTERGYTTFTCECGDSYVEDYTDPTGHNFVDGVCANGCGTTATVIPESALFTDITCNAEGTITVSEEEPIVDSDLVFPYYHVILPAGATTVYVTFPTADAIQNDGSYAWVRGLRIPEFEQTADYSPACVINEDGSVTVTLSVSAFYAEEAGNGVAACFWKDGTVNQMITFCNAASEGGEEPAPTPEYKSEYGITVLVDGEEMDLVANGTETCGTLEAQILNVTVPAGTTEVTFLNITDEVVYGQMYVYSGSHDWTEYASNVTEATINLEECGTSFCVSDSANNWYHVTITVEEPAPSYKSEYGITVLVGGEEMDLVANGTETCGTLEAQILNVTVPAGTTEVTFLNITDEVVYGQMYVYSGSHDWTEYASNVTEATINLEECGTSFCVSDSANKWYHVTITVEEPPHEHSYESVVTDPTCTEGGYTTYTCACGDSYVADETEALGHTEETVPGKAATCTEAGMTDGVKCSICGEILAEQEEIAALGHSFSNGTCTVCGEADPDYVAPSYEPVTVYFSASHDDQYMMGEGGVAALREVTVPYFDLALYGLEDFYFQSEDYGSDSGNIGDNNFENAEPYEGKITMLHLFLYATETIYLGLSPEDAGLGYLNEAGLMGSEVFNLGGSVGSCFLNYFWNYDMNLNYYLNYEYPLASEGWGATADQILLEDGDIVTLGQFISYSFYSDSTSIFNYMVADNNAPKQGETVTLTLYCAGPNMGNTDGTAQNLVTYMPDVYYISVDELSDGDVTTWNYLGYADENGQIVLDTADLAPGQYIVAMPGQYGMEYPDDIVSTPGGVILTVEENDHVHSYEAVVTDPTCTEGGYTTYTCACGDSYVADETAALGHTEETVPGKAATCTETGLTDGVKCSVCGEMLVEQEEIAALEHHFENGVCTECGAEDPDYEAPHEHSYIAVVTEPTCTEAGYTTYTCECGESYIADKTAALGHTAVIDAAVEATCTETGLTEGEHCSVCGEVLVAQEEIPATGHNFEDGICTECGEEEESSVPSTPVEPGWQSWFEKWFGGWWDDEEEECEHSYSSVVTDPTCTEKGYTTHTCEKCGDSYKDSYTDALGHNYEDGVCTNCGAEENKKPGWNWHWFWPFW